MTKQGKMNEKEKQNLAGVDQHKSDDDDDDDCIIINYFVFTI